MECSLKDITIHYEEFGSAGYRDAWNILEHYPRATCVVLDRAGHFLEDSNPLVHVLINNWLDRVEESAGLL